MTLLHVLSHVICNKPLYTTITAKESRYSFTCRCQGHPALSHAPISLFVTVGDTVSKAESGDSRRAKCLCNCSTDALVFRYCSFIEKCTVTKAQGVCCLVQGASSDSGKSEGNYFSSWKITNLNLSI